MWQDQSAQRFHFRLLSNSRRQRLITETHLANTRYSDMYQQSSKTMSQTAVSMANQSSWRYGILQARKTMKD